MEEGTAKVEALNDLSRELWSGGNFDDGMVYANEAIKLSDRYAFLKGSGDAYDNLGNIYEGLGNYAQALNSYYLSLRKREESKNSNDIINSYGDIAEIFRLLRNYPEALRYDSAALKLSNEGGYKKGAADAFSWMGNVYWGWAFHLRSLNSDTLNVAQKLQTALLSYSHALGIDSMEQNERRMARDHLNIGLILLEQKKYNESLVNLNRSLNIQLRSNNQAGAAIAYANIGSVYFQQGNYTAAIGSFTNELKCGKENEDLGRMSLSYHSLGMVYAKIHANADALSCFQKSLDLARTTGEKLLLRRTYEAFSDFESSIGDFRKSLEYYKLFIAIRDTMLGEENTKKTVQLQMQYEFDKKQAADSIRNSENIKQEEIKHDRKIQQQRMLTYGGGIGFFLMLVVAGVSFRAYRQKQKDNEIISIQKSLVEEKQKEILDSIHYAKRIQQSLLPTEKYIDRKLLRHNA